MGTEARAQGVAADGLGNTYVAGHFSGTLTLSPAVVLRTNSANDQHGYVAKYDPAGTLLWARQLRCAGNLLMGGVAVDAAGNCYLGDQTYGPQVQLGTLLLVGSGDLVAKFDPQGNPQWLRHLGTAPASNFPPYFLSDIGLDTAGNLYLTGIFYGTLAFGSLTLTNGSPNNAVQDLFVAKYDPTGTTAL